MISVLMSTYNGEKFIIKQLNSIYRQTLQADEVIIIDDKSTDSTYQLIYNFIAENQLLKKWKLIQNEVNKGWRYNFHYGVEFTNGDYIFYADQDDIWLDNKIEICIRIMNENSELNALATNEKRFYDNNSTDCLYKDEDLLEIVDVNKNHQSINIKCSGCTMVVKKNFLDKIKKYYIDSFAHDDMVWKFASIDGSIAVYHRYTILHRIHSNNASRIKIRDLQSKIKNNLGNINNYLQVILFLKDNFPQKTDLINLYYNYVEAMKARNNFFTSKKIRYLFSCIKNYRYLYDKPKNLLGDILITMID